MSIHKVVDALNAAFAADPGAMRSLMINRVPCNMGLCNDPYVICEEDRNLAGDHFSVGALGVINGVLAAAGLPLVAAKWDMREDGPNVFAGFMAYIQPEPISSDEQSPQPDQYWQHKKSDDRVYFIGRTPDGEMVWQCEGDNVEIGDLDWSGWEHLAGCDSWEWKSEAVKQVSVVNPPVTEQKFPLYVKDCCGMIFRADSRDRIFWLPIYGGEYLQLGTEDFWNKDSELTPLTEFEVCEILNRSVKSAVKAPSDIMGQSPDDWVTQDRVEPRHNIDQIRWSNFPDGIWVDPCGDWTGELHGFVDTEDRSTLSVRCRRADLPVVTARIPVALYWYDGAIVGRYADSPVTDPSFVPIHSDGNGGWFIERSTNAGN